VRIFGQALENTPDGAVWDRTNADDLASRLDIP
jgi:hypothetical protein